MLFGNENKLANRIRNHNLSKKKTSILPTCFQENYGGSFGEISNTSYSEFRAVRVNKDNNLRN